MDKSEALNALFGEIIEEMKDSSNKKLEEITKSVNDNIESLEKKMSASLKKLDDILENKPITVNFGTVEKPDNEVTHKAFNKILKVLQSAKRKDKHIMLVGGAGGGKTHLAGQIAKALGIQFYPMSVGLQTTKSDLLGFISATGNYITSPVREAYEKGGLLLLDEFDATHAGVVTILNSLLANGHATFPDKIIEKNEKFVCMCACNTYGRGGNIDYVGRNKLDGATLDRFIIIDVDYDLSLERNLANNDTWVDVIDKVRENAKKQGIKMIISPRASMDGADLLESGFSPSEVMDMVIYKGCDEDIKKKLSQGVALSNVRKRPNRREALPTPQPTTEQDESLFAKEDTRGFSERMIYLDFDDDRYFVKGLDGLSLESKDVGFSIFIGTDTNTYYPELATSTLFLNNDREPSGFGNVIHDMVIPFIETIEKHAKDCHELPFLIRVKYREVVKDIIMGE